MFNHAPSPHPEYLNTSQNNSPKKDAWERDLTEGCSEYGEQGEFSDVTVESDRGSDREEFAQEDHLSLQDTVTSEEEEPPAPKAPPRVSHSGTNKQPRATGREAVSSAEEEPPLPNTRSTIAQAPTPKPREGKKAAAPGPAPPPGNPTDEHPDAHAAGSGQPPTTERARDTPPQAGWSPTQPTIGGLAGVFPLFPGLINSRSVVPVPVTMSRPSPLCLCQSPSVCAFLCLLLCWSLLALASGGLPGPLADCPAICH
ncbi:hypothetical protein P4O66_012204 [Electrophorus voltai]|uniref:Uncharacterized protein n=1 Tax=Electrophorus voltai TaxID=2609070 RepID=A0AAD9DT54_9TELE|nr:hypothetical protein P4O66_012204 [Electrophorus voltai]